jgi:hypothetical protein
VPKQSRQLQFAPSSGFLALNHGARILGLYHWTSILDPHPQFRALGAPVLNEVIRNRIFDPLFDETPQRPRAGLRIDAALRKKPTRNFWFKLDVNVCLCQNRRRFIEQKTGHLEHAVLVERIKDDDLIQTIDEFRRKMAPQLTVNKLSNLLRFE